MLKKMLKSVLPIALVIAMLFSQSVFAETTVGIYALGENDVADEAAGQIPGVKEGQKFAVIVNGASGNEMVTILIYKDVEVKDGDNVTRAKNNTYDDGEEILYIWQIDAVGGKATFTVTLPDDVKAGDVAAVAIGTENNQAATYAATGTINVVADVVYHTVTWKNYDGTVLATNDQVAEGETATYTGETPTKAADAQYTYTFDKWSDPVTDENGNVTYTAIFTETVNKYEIKFVNEDGTELQKTEVAYGEMPAYTGETPVKPATTQYTYAFAGWTPEIKAVDGAATYTATFTETVNKYEIKFVNEDGTELQKTEVAYGEMPVYGGETPTKAATTQYTYAFAGWTPEIKAVDGAATYTATFTETVNKYEIKFVNEDGTELQKTEVAYGATPVYNGATPVKAEDEENTYTFKGWDPEITAVTGEATYTAEFTAIPKNVWTVKFDGEAKTVTKDESIKLEAAEKNGYQFVGWSNGTDFLPAGYDYTPDANVEFTSVWVDITMKDGAAIRLDATNPGIRFTTLVDAANYTAIKDLDENVKMGTLIATESALNRGNLLNSFTIDAINDYNAKLTEGKEIWAANVNAKYLYNDGKNGEDVDYRAVMIVKQPQTNKAVYTTNWVARSYIEVNYTNDTSDIFYAAEPMLRSLEYVADKVIEAGYKDADGKDLDDAAKAIINEYANTSVAE